MSKHEENVSNQAVESAKRELKLSIAILRSESDQLIERLEQLAGDEVDAMNARLKALFLGSAAQSAPELGPNDRSFTTTIAAGGKLGDEFGSIPLSGALVKFTNDLHWFIGAGSPLNEKGSQLFPGRRYQMTTTFRELVKEKAPAPCDYDRDARWLCVGGKGHEGICVPAPGAGECSTCRANGCNSSDCSCGCHGSYCESCSASAGDLKWPDGLCSPCDDQANGKATQASTQEEGAALRQVLGREAVALREGIEDLLHDNYSHKVNSALQRLLDNVRKEESEFYIERANLLGEARADLECLCNGMEEKDSECCLRCRIRKHFGESLFLGTWAEPKEEPKEISFVGYEQDECSKCRSCGCVCDCDCHLPVFTTPSKEEPAPKEKPLCINAHPKWCNNNYHPPECPSLGFDCNPVQLHCKVCNVKIDVGNCCSEQCTKKWVNTRNFAGDPRLCRKCGTPHEMKSNYCGDCDGLTQVDTHTSDAPSKSHCLNCNAEVYVGNCCGERCTSEWMAKKQAEHVPKPTPDLCGKTLSDGRSPCAKYSNHHGFCTAVLPITHQCQNLVDDSNVGKSSPCVREWNHEGDCSNKVQTPEKNSWSKNCGCSKVTLCDCPLESTQVASPELCGMSIASHLGEHSTFSRCNKEPGHNDPCTATRKPVPEEHHAAPQPCCLLPPSGWQCSRGSGHEGPCAATVVERENLIEKLEHAHAEQQKRCIARMTTLEGVPWRCCKQQGHTGAHARSCVTCGDEIENKRQHLYKTCLTCQDFADAVDKGKKR